MNQPSVGLFEKPCVRCGETDRDVRGGCRPCKKTRMTARYQADPQRLIDASVDWAKANPEKVRAARLRRMYNISLEQYSTMLAAQGGCCAICEQSETALDAHGMVKDLSVDHDHACCPGKTSCGRCIRGLLCHRHNLAIGLLGDSRALLAAADTYLRRYSPPATVALALV
jgi:hypothetical protein